MKAFPISGLSNMTGGQLYEAVYQPGMELRDYFAAKAMQGLIEALVSDTSVVPYTHIVDMAYKTADKMMEVRK